MAQRRQQVKTTVYVDGNTVRRLDTAPDYRREREEKRQREIRRHNESVARRNQERALHMNRGYVVFLTMAALMTAMVSATYIKLQSELTGHLKSIAALESSVSELKADNDSAYKRISTAVDLQTVKDTAINQLGMVYAGEDQIVYYTVENDDYMNQYSEIPEQ